MSARPVQTTDPELVAKIEALLARSAGPPAPREDDYRAAAEWRMWQAMTTGRLDVDVTASSTLSDAQRAELHAWLRGDAVSTSERRVPSLVEVARGVDCCQPDVVAFWRRWRARWGALTVVAIVACPAFVLAGMGLLWCGLASVIGSCALWSHADSGQGWQVCPKGGRR